MVQALALLVWVSGRGLVEAALVLQALVLQGLVPHSQLLLDRLAYTCHTSNCTSHSSRWSGVEMKRNE
jgi:hypothetical protein